MSQIRWGIAKAHRPPAVKTRTRSRKKSSWRGIGGEPQGKKGEIDYVPLGVEGKLRAIVKGREGKKMEEVSVQRKARSKEMHCCRENSSCPNHARRNKDMVEKRRK